MFDSYYSFSIPEDYLYSVYDFTPATQNREHEHSDIEEGLDEYTYNWECLDTDSSRRRGSDKIYLVEDQYYVWSARTGMEKAGNSVEFSENSPYSLRFDVLKTLFENVSQRKFGDIKEGLKKTEVEQGMSVMTPKAFVLKQKLTEDELVSYFDEMAELTVDLISRYHTIESIDELNELIEWYSDSRTQIFRDYTNFEPTILAQVVNSIEGVNGWKAPDDVDKGKSFTILMHEEFGQSENGFVESVIQIDETPQTVELIHNDGESEKVLEKEKYSSVEELRHYLEKFMQFTPSEEIKT